MRNYITPFHSITQYRDGLYKIVTFKTAGAFPRETERYVEKKEAESYDHKLDNSFSRARSMVLQYALCNNWTWFFTGTIDQTRFDRFDLDKYYRALSQFIRDKRKAYGQPIRFLLVPEHHADGAWHIHGLLQGLDIPHVVPFGPEAPEKLRDAGFLNWPDYQAKFGFCSLGLIRNPLATAFYISKYVSKDMSQRAEDLGKHLYFHSRGLARAEKISEVFLPSPDLDAMSVSEFEFCKTGFVQGGDWMFPYMWDGVDLSNIEPFNMPVPIVNPRAVLADFDPSTVEPAYEQLKIYEMR